MWKWLQRQSKSKAVFKPGYYPPSTCPTSHHLQATTITSRPHQPPVPPDPTKHHHQAPAATTTRPQKQLSLDLYKITGSPLAILEPLWNLVNVQLSEFLIAIKVVVRIVTIGALRFGVGCWPVQAMRSYPRLSCCIEPHSSQKFADPSQSAGTYWHYSHVPGHVLCLRLSLHTGGQSCRV